MTAVGAIDFRLSSEDLVNELDARIEAAGGGRGLWPGLAFYRFTDPADPKWEESKPLSIGIFARTGRQVGAAADRRGSTCVVVGNLRAGACRPFDASPEQPFLGFVLEVEPQLVAKVSADSLLCHRPPLSEDVGEECMVSGVDDVLMGSAVRFLRSLSIVADRRVLAPLYLQEMVYRVLQRDHCAHMVRIAAQQLTINSLSAALDYVAAHLADPLTVTELARQVNLSPSAFSRLFRESTGRSPYQYVKEERLCRARDLLDEGRLGVTDVSRSVGYLSPSHFIKEFRHRFGSTPGEYLVSHTWAGRVRAHRATSASAGSNTRSGAGRRG